MLRIALRADVHAALQQALFQHRVHVHERLDRDALDALPEEPAHPVALPQQGDRMRRFFGRSEEHTSELQSLAYLVCRLLLEKKKDKTQYPLCRTMMHAYVL